MSGKRAPPNLRRPSAFYSDDYCPDSPVAAVLWRSAAALAQPRLSSEPSASRHQEWGEDASPALTSSALALHADSLSGQQALHRGTAEQAVDVLLLRAVTSVDILTAVPVRRWLLRQWPLSL